MTTDQLSCIHAKRADHPESTYRAIAAHLESIAARTPAVILRTCERAELYRIAETTDQPPATLCEHTNLPLSRTDHATRHLFRVAAGLDSRIVGEPHILGQVRAALDHARSDPDIPTPLLRVFERAIAVGRRARSDTGLERVASSYVSRATDAVLLRAQNNPLRVGILGSGALARECAAVLTNHSHIHAELVARHPERAAQLAATLGVVTRHLDKLPERLANLDALIAATSSPNVLLTPDMLPADARPRLLIDLADAPNIDRALARAPRTTLLTLDDLAAGGCPASPIIERAERLVHDAAQRFIRKHARNTSTPT